MLRSLTSGLVLAFAGSRANVSRTILSCAGIVVGVAALITVVTAGHVGERYAIAYSEANWGVAATYDVTLPGNVDDPAALKEDLERAGAQAAAMNFSPQSGIRLRQGDQEIRDVQFTVTDPDLDDIRRMNLTEGRWFEEGDTGSLAPVVVLTDELADQLEADGGFEGLQIGSRQWRDVRVVGVVESTAMDSFGGEGGTAYLLNSPASEEMAFPEGVSEAAGMMGGLQYAVRVPPEGADPEGFKNRLAGAAWRWAPDADAGTIDVYRMDDAEAIDEVLGYLSLGLLGIAAITLTTGLLGVLNVGLVTVRERRRELAVYRAMGADRLSMFVVVVAEAVVVAMVAGVIALALCYGAAGVAHSLLADMLPDGVVVTVPVSGVLVGLGSAAGVGLLAGIIPAWRALRISVVAGLRE
ncbi:ABC transporter permease [Nocardiopsis sp. RSe5-2]|uniref:ABC transporter permease n=1 Tax=Nocardiopsis endophytica TaxID=3018445 RepID=A0ABT4U4W2_9ACTN|nr:ABC transporter permease [Nocardiopsis endophytica]MDA2811994.1 ABC transporter permease [Nocardiopsis endophytica]